MKQENGPVQKQTEPLKERLRMSSGGTGTGERADFRNAVSRSSRNMTSTTSSTAAANSAYAKTLKVFVFFPISIHRPDFRAVCKV